MDTDFYNLYVETILNEVGEVNKTKLLLQTQITYQEKKIQEMTELQNRLQQANNELNERVRQLTEKAEKKAAKKSQPEVAATEEGF